MGRRHAGVLLGTHRRLRACGAHDVDLGRLAHSPRSPDLPGGSCRQHLQHRLAPVPPSCATITPDETH
eukprot:7165011-Heterocapsa_arctica.AAC.1